MTSHYGALAPTTIMLMVMEMIMEIVVEIEYHHNKHMKMMVVVKDVAVQMRKAIAS